MFGAQSRRLRSTRLEVLRVLARRVLLEESGLRLVDLRARLPRPVLLARGVRARLHRARCVRARDLAGGRASRAVRARRTEGLALNACPRAFCEAEAEVGEIRAPHVGVNCERITLDGGVRAALDPHPRHATRTPTAAAVTSQIDGFRRRQRTRHHRTPPALCHSRKWPLCSTWSCTLTTAHLVPRALRHRWRRRRWTRAAGPLRSVAMRRWRGRRTQRRPAPRGTRRTTTSARPTSPPRQPASAS